jgi:uncharacterized membrane protein
MNLRRALHEQAISNGLDAPALSRLYKLARLTGQPEALPMQWRSACALAGGGLVGAAALMWIAANWAMFGRFGRLGMAEAVVLLPIVLMLRRPEWRLPLALIALLGIGALFACLGQTYQTGADPWELFAVWALLALPLCLGARYEATWVPWVIVVISAICLWQTSQLPRWYGYWPDEDEFLPVQIATWAASIALSLVLRLHLSTRLGVGRWSRGVALISSVVLIMLPVLQQIWRQIGIEYWLALVIFALFAVALTTRSYVEIFGLALLLLALNVLIDTGFASWLLNDPRFNQWHFVAILFSIAGVSVAMLAVTTKWLFVALKLKGDTP